MYQQGIMGEQGIMGVLWGNRSQEAGDLVGGRPDVSRLAFQTDWWSAPAKKIFQYEFLPHFIALT